MSETHWYRVEASRYAHWDGDSERVVGYDYTAQIKEYKVLKHTPKGVWLDTAIFVPWAETSFGERPKKFVKRDTRKRWACPTKAEALESFLQRKRRRVEILTAQIVKEKGMVAEAHRVCARELGYPTDIPSIPEILKYKAGLPL